MIKEDTLWHTEGGGSGPWSCSQYPGFLLKKVEQPGYPKWWLITNDDDVPKVKANLGDFPPSEAKIRFILWMEGKTWN